MRIFAAALCAFALLLTLAIAADEFGVGGRPWFGWWDSTLVVVGPYTLSIRPRPNGAASKAGFRSGDLIDLRAQTVTARIAVNYQPMATQRTRFIAQRGSRTAVISFLGSTVWDNASFWKLQPMATRLAANLLFILCAAVLLFRRRNDVESAVVAVTFLCLVGTMLDPSFFVVPNASIALLMLVLSRACAAIVALLFVLLARRSPTPLRILACAIVLAAFASDLLAVVGLSNARVDPLPFILSLSPWRSALDVAVWAVVVLTVATARRSLLIPLPAGLFVSSLCFASPAFVRYWFANVAVAGAANVAVPVGALLTLSEAFRDPGAIVTSKAQLYG